jgi:isocitrate/isopropylmalate dehydrogenase
LVTTRFGNISLEGQANTIAEAVYSVLAEGKVRTADMGGTSIVRRRLDPLLHLLTVSVLPPGSSKTSDFTKEVINKV